MKRNFLSSIYLTDEQLKTLANIGIAAGQISAGSMVVPLVFPTIDTAKYGMILLGSLFTLGFWGASVILVRRIKQ